jgi:hypothetical protein
VRVFHKVKHCTNGDAVECLANAFDKYANVDFGRLKEQLKNLVTSAGSSVDALRSKTRDLSRTEQRTPRPMIVFTPRPPNLSKY